MKLQGVHVCVLWVCICISQHFAMMEAHLILATLAQRVTFELVPPFPLVLIRFNPVLVPRP